MSSGPTVNRRGFLAAAASVAAVGLAAPAEAARRPPAIKSLLLENVHTGDRLKTTFWADGKYVRSSMHEVNWILRDHHSGDVHAMDPRLLDLLYDLKTKLRTPGPIQIISGYRSPSTNAMLASMTDGVARNSLHMQGMAVDIRVPDRQLRKVHKAAVSLEAGGVGYYPRSGFVHVDVGRIRYW
jgi:uncharacterized protein YcbK (DUF882 family)